jgi:hypothetical protein
MAGEAAPTAATGKTSSGHGLAFISHALGALRLAWGDVYTTGHDDKGYWAARPDRMGSLMRADSPEELGRLLADDFGGRRE